MYIKLKQQHKWTMVCLNLEKHKENGVIRIRDSLVDSQIWIRPTRLRILNTAYSVVDPYSWIRIRIPNTGTARDPDPREPNQCGSMRIRNTAKNSESFLHLNQDPDLHYEYGYGSSDVNLMQLRNSGSMNL